MTARGGAAMRAKGSAFERAVVRVLRAHGIPADRAYGAGRPDDRGDIDGVPGFVIEVKNHRRMDLAGWMDEAIRETLAASSPSLSGARPVVVAKRRGKPAEDAYVVMRLMDWADLVKKGP